MACRWNFTGAKKVAICDGKFASIFHRIKILAVADETVGNSIARGREGKPGNAADECPLRRQWSPLDSRQSIVLQENRHIEQCLYADAGDDPGRG